MATATPPLMCRAAYHTSPLVEVPPPNSSLPNVEPISRRQKATISQWARRRIHGRPHNFIYFLVTEEMMKLSRHHLFLSSESEGIPHQQFSLLQTSSQTWPSTGGHTERYSTGSDKTPKFIALNILFKSTKYKQNVQKTKYIRESSVYYTRAHIGKYISRLDATKHQKVKRFKEQETQCHFNPTLQRLLLDFRISELVKLICFCFVHFKWFWSTLHKCWYSCQAAIWPCSPYKHLIGK